MTAVRDKFWVFAGQALVIKDLVFSAADETRVAFHTCDEPVAVSRNRETRERPEFGGL